VPILSNDHLSFNFDTDTGYFDLRLRAAAAPCLLQARLGAIYSVPHHDQRRRVYWDGELSPTRVEVREQVHTPHGPARTLAVQARTSILADEPLAVTVTFALPEAQPFLLWHVEVANAGHTPLWLDVIDLVRVGPRFQPRAGRSSRWYRLRTWLRSGPEEEPHPGGPAGTLSLGPAPGVRAGRLAFFCNGYQSWSFAGALQAGDHQPSSMFGPYGDPKALNLVTPRFRRAGRFTSDMFGVVGDTDHQAGLVAGFLSQREQFSAVEVLLDPEAPSLRLTAQCDDVSLAPGEARVSDWAYLQFADLRQPDPLGAYAEAVARENDARVPAHTPVGWCSWYHYFDRVTERDMLANLDALVKERARLPLDFVQLDDGFQAQVGDWFETKPTFPHGLRWLSDRIRAKDLTPGLWLAPYIVRSDARLLRQHPEWCLRDARGRLASAGFNWGRWCYALDPTHPDVRAHVHRLIETAVQEWGFPYLKLDFLYAAALPAKRYDASLTRAQAMRQALSDIRAAAGPEVFLLGCGCPLGSAVGLVDGMRVSTDVAPDWDPTLLTPHLAPLLIREMDFVGVRNAIRNTINRAPLHRRWWLNDPDCLLVRDHDTNLTEAEVRSLATVIALTGGMFLVSDDMSRLRPERQRYIAALLPLLGARPQVPGWLGSHMPDLLVLRLSGAVGEWVVVGAFNWGAHRRERSLDLAALGLQPDQDHYVSEFWDHKTWLHPAGQPLALEPIPRHGARLLALRPRCDGPALAGTSFHFSQGQEITRWRVDGASLAFTIELGRRAEGHVDLALPAAPRRVEMDGAPLSVLELGHDLYRLNLQVNGSATVRVQWHFA
jgi:alpha-galactosidase